MTALNRTAPGAQKQTRASGHRLRRVRNLLPLPGIVPVDERDAFALPEFAQRCQRIAHGARIPHRSADRKDIALEMFPGVAGIAGEDELQMCARAHTQ